MDPRGSIANVCVRWGYFIRDISHVRLFWTIIHVGSDEPTVFRYTNGILNAKLWILEYMTSLQWFFFLECFLNDIIILSVQQAKIVFYALFVSKYKLCSTTVKLNCLDNRTAFIKKNHCISENNKKYQNHKKPIVICLFNRFS